MEFPHRRDISYISPFRWVHNPRRNNDISYISPFRWVHNPRRNNGDAIPDTLRRTIRKKCIEIEVVLIEGTCLASSGKDSHKMELERNYEDLGKEVLSSKDTPDWKNVEENLQRMYNEHKSAEREERDKWLKMVETFRKALESNQNGFTMTQDDGQSLQDGEEPKRIMSSDVGQSLQNDEELKRKIQIKVKTVKGEKHLLKDLTSRDLILTVKGKIASKVRGMKEGEIILLYAGNELCDNETLDTYGIINGSTMNMLPRSPGKGVMESATKVLNEARNVLKYLGKWIPELFVDTSRKVTELELSKIVPAIGDGWELLGVALGLNSVQLQHISADYNTMKMKIFTMLTTWLDENQSKATFDKLYETMKDCRNRNTVSFNWKKVKRIFAGV